MKMRKMLLCLTIASSLAAGAVPFNVYAADYTQSDLNAASDTLASAKEEETKASQRVELIQKVIPLQMDAEKKKAALDTARKARDDAQAGYDQINQSVSAELESAKAEVSEAQTAYEAAKAKFDEGVYGFYESRGSTGALYVLENATYASYTKKGDPDDATSLDNVKASFQWIRKCNELRASEGLSPLLVNDLMMAASESDTNWSDSHIAHAQQFNVGENLAWGYRDPFDGWYTEEKANYESNNGGETGHYLNIIMPSYTSTGFSICTRNGLGYGITHGQTFSYMGGADLDTYEKAFNAYYDSVDPSAKKAALDEANQKVSGLEAQIENAKKALTEAQEAYDAATEEYNSASRKYQSALTEAGISDSADLEEALAEAQAHSSNVNKAIETLNAYYASVEKAVSGVRMYRLYNPNSGEHFYTASAGERNSLVRSGWKYEGIGWTAPDKSSTPVYRLYNANAGDHHYTMSLSERNHLVRVGWKDEGIGWYSDDAKEKPLYRQYNPNAKAGSHNYTLSKSENDHLVKLGWKGEGVGWYGIDTEAKAMPDVSALLK